ncbi:hypothetical protein SNEBB_001538 [Seison nebaliae]|nr:hypothetical protein SNEBB_001538 [Seison nebaliae]
MFRLVNNRKKKLFFFYSNNFILKRTKVNIIENGRGKSIYDFKLPCQTTPQLQSAKSSKFNVFEGKGFSNFGHMPKRMKSVISKIWIIFLPTVSFIALFSETELLKFKPSETVIFGVRLSSIFPSLKSNDEVLNSTIYKNQLGRHQLESYSERERLLIEKADDEEEEDKRKIHLPKVMAMEKKDGERDDRPTFRERKIIEYENRIRSYSTPDKIFRYFATIKLYTGNDQEHEVFMTPDDFVRSITPGIMQPEGLGLDAYHRYDNLTDIPHHVGKLTSENSMFYKIATNGLIGYSDFVFLLTLLSASPRHFEIAFKMFDFDGNGNVDLKEFSLLQDSLRQHTVCAQRHRDPTSSSLSGSQFNSVTTLKDSSSLTKYFFGENFDEKLTTEKFMKFYFEIQKEILMIEFRRIAKEKPKMTEEDFASSLLIYSGIPAKRYKKMLQRVRRQFRSVGEGVNFESYYSFFHFLRNIQQVDTALTFYHVAGASISPSVLYHVAEVVSNVKLNPHLIDVVFTLFDENGDGQLSKYEFMKIMKQRMQRGLQQPKDTGFMKFIKATATCTNEMYLGF